MNRQIILTIAICFGIANGQLYSVIFHNDFPPSYIPIGVTSRTFGVSLTQNPTPDAPVTVNLASTGLQFSPSSFTFTATSAVVQSFTVTAVALGTQVINVTGTVAEQFFSVYVTQRVIYAQEQTTYNSVGQWTNFISFATSYDDPSSDLAIHTNLTSTDMSRISLSNLDTQLSNDKRGGYLTVRSDVEGFSTLRFQPVGSRADWYQISSTTSNLVIAQRSISVPPNLNTFKVGERVSFQILLSKPSSGSLSVTPAGSGLFFEPSTVTIAAGSLSSTVTVYAKFASASPVAISYTVSGSDAVMYDFTGSTTIASIVAPQVTCTPVTFTAAYKQPVHINCRADTFTDSVTITPTGEGMSFSPLSITFSAGCTSATFEMTPSVVGQIPIYYDMSGDNFYAQFSPSSQIHTITVNKRIVSITGPSVNVAGGENFLTVSLYGSDTSALYPPYTSLTVTPCTQSSGLVSFEPSELTFDNTQSVGAISVRPLVPGATKVDFGFTLSGEDAYGFQIISSYSTQIVNNQFEVKYYSDEEHIKQYQRLPALNTTEAFNISVYNLVGNVTLTPESAVVSFTPPSYTFTRTDTTAYFNVTGMRSGTSFVTFKLTGDSARMFAIPKPALQITVLGSSAAVTLASTLLLTLCALIVM